MKTELRAIVTALALSTGAPASADWLAVDPGTEIALQVNSNGALVVRPVGGIWSHPLCSDVSLAVLKRTVETANSYDAMVQTLSIAAATGSLVNVNAAPDTCHENGYPLIISVRIQSP